jgi:hypothetical protein
LEYHLQTQKNLIVMKKFLTLLVLVCGVASLQAQDLRVGPKIGINASSAGGDIDPDGLTAIRAGGFVEIGLSDAFFLQPELLYSAKGYEFSRSGISVETSLNYLSVPIMAKYAFVDNGSLQVTGQAGPYVGFLLSAETGGSDVADNTSSVDIGGQVGVGAAYRIGPGSLTLDVRAGFGFTNVNDSGNNQSVTNQMLPSATVGYAFSL